MMSKSEDESAKLERLRSQLEDFGRVCPECGATSLRRQPGGVGFVPRQSRRPSFDARADIRRSPSSKASTRRRCWTKRSEPAWSMRTAG